MGSIANIPNEVQINILLALERNEIEKCQLVCQKWNGIVSKNVDFLPLHRIESLFLGKEYISGPSKELYASVRYLTINENTNHYKLIDEDDGEDHSCWDDEYECDLPCADEFGFLEQELIRAKPESKIEINFEKIKTLNQCVIEKCFTIYNAEETMVKTFEKLHEISGHKLNVICYNAMYNRESLTTVVTKYMTAFKVKLAYFYEKFHTNFIQIPIPPKEVFIRFRHVCVNNTDLDKLKHVDGGQRYSLTSQLDVDFDFLNRLLEHYQKVESKNLIKKLKFELKGTSQMYTAIMKFNELLKVNDFPLITTKLSEHKCKNDDKVRKKEHRKDVYTVKQTGNYAVQVHLFTDISKNNICIIKFYVQCL